MMDELFGFQVEDLNRLVTGAGDDVFIISGHDHRHDLI